jgi:hypothetical protein
LYNHDTESVAAGLFRQKHGDIGVYTTRANPLDHDHGRAHEESLGVYPLQGMEDAQRVNGGENRLFSTFSQEQQAEMEHKAQWAAACRAAGGWCEDAADLQDATTRALANMMRVD